MIDITGDNKIYQHAKLLESISSGEGGRFLYAYYDKKYAGNLLTKGISALYQSGSYQLQISDFKSFILLENLLQDIDEVLKKFFADYESSQSKKADSEATDIRDKERELVQYLSLINNAFSYHGVNAIYEALLEIFPKKATSNFRTCVASLSAHYMEHGSKIDIKGVGSISDLMGTVNFDKARGPKYIVI